MTTSTAPTVADLRKAVQDVQKELAQLQADSKRTTDELMRAGDSNALIASGYEWTLKIRTAEAKLAKANGDLARGEYELRAAERDAVNAKLQAAFPHPDAKTLAALVSEAVKAYGSCDGISVIMAFGADGGILGTSSIKPTGVPTFKAPSAKAPSGNGERSPSVKRMPAPDGNIWQGSKGEFIAQYGEVKDVADHEAHPSWVTNIVDRICKRLNIAQVPMA